MTSGSLQIEYVVVDVFPKFNSEMFTECAGAAVGCWVRSRDYHTEDAAESLVASKLGSSGWSIARVVLRETVGPETYAAKREGYEFYEQALSDGFVANFHVVRRKNLGAELPEAFDLRAAFQRFSELVSQNGAISLYAERDQQWANGATSEDDEFVPLWSNESELKDWFDAWPDYRARQLHARDLCSGFLDQLNESDMWIALALTGKTLTTFHPIQLKESLSLLGPTR